MLLTSRVLDACGRGSAVDIELTSSPEQVDLETISRGIQTYNQGHIPDAVVFEPDTRFAVFARDHEGDVVGGIRATAFWNYCIIELMWLSEHVRGQGLGTRLMQRAEEHARAHGFGYVRTETLDVQARPFYESLGYAVFGELVDYPVGHTTYCMVKQLTP